MKRWLGIIAIIALIFTACSGDNDGSTNGENTDNKSNADFSVLYGEWQFNNSFSNVTYIFIISEDKIEYYCDLQTGGELELFYKCEIQTVKEDVNITGSHKNEYPEGFLIESVIIEDGDPTDNFYVVGTSRTLRFYLNENKDKMENNSNIYIKVSK